MGYYILKVFVSSVLIVAIAEISKRSTVLGGLLASLPIVSIMAMIWLYVDTQDLAKIQTLSSTIFWLALPSLALFLLLPLFIVKGFGFWMSLLFSIAGTGCCYLTLIVLIKRQLLNI